MLSTPLYRYIDDLTSRVAAESGIASDRQHVGKIILRCFKDVPDMIMQIDGATNEKETCKSALERSVRCATSFRNIGLKYQDVVVIMAPNHIDLTIPMYAAFYLGINVAGIDMHLTKYELIETLRCVEPKMIFCENFNVKTVEEALTQLNMSVHIVTFGDKKEHMTFSEFVDKYADNTTVETFKPADFEPKVTTMLLGATSGSTGVPKSVIMTHENIITSFAACLYNYDKFPMPFNFGLVISPLQWLSAFFQFIMSPILKYSRLQTSALMTPEHVDSLIKKFKPEFLLVSPTFLTSLLNYCEFNSGDFTSFKYIMVGGSAVPVKLANKIKRLAPHAHIHIGYGLTEISGPFCIPDQSPINSIGKPLSYFQYKIVNVDTNETINEVNKTGELRLKGPTVTKGYYNNPEVTALAFDEDGWFKTGDLLYKDEHSNFYFVDRMKLLLKYRNHQVSPTELENVIIQHPGVIDVVVTGIPDEECGDLPVAVVVPRDDFNVTAQEIKDIVKNSLTETKQLRGGVIFVKELPTTATSKIDRPKVKQLAMTMERG